ncbi:putative transcription regulator containing HTH domain [Candidatus Sulfopaludibacter sp. SbA4]|nr:putative transcription regulator containing HTH domain [Candidatus Sulfopaludibacter sp. SbA4]
MEKMSAVAEIQNEREYAELLAEVLPHVIHTEEENARCTAALEKLLAKRNRTPEEYRLTELLTLLIEDFEAKRYSLQPASPLDILRHLMESNGLRQVDLIGVFGTASIVSEVLSGKRALAKSHIAKLSRRFNVSAQLFLGGRSA